MKGLTLFLAGLLIGVLYGRQNHSAATEVAVDVEDLLSSSAFPSTIRLRARPVSKGSENPAR